MKNLLKKKDFAEAGALYFIATLFNKGIGFVTVPIFSRILTTSDYGTVTTFNSWVSMISVFISLALYNAVRNSFVDMDDKERPHFLSTIITFTGLVFLTVMGVCVVGTIRPKYKLSFKINKIAKIDKTTEMSPGRTINAARNLYL